MERAKNPCRARGEGDRDGYAPEKRWSPSTVGRKRKYWDWFSRTRDRASTLGTQRVAHDVTPSPSPPPSSSSFATKRSPPPLPCPPSPPRVGTDSLLTRREPRCAIHFCPLTSFPRLPLSRVQGLHFAQWGIPLSSPTPSIEKPVSTLLQPMFLFFSDRL